MLETFVIIYNFSCKVCEKCFGESVEKWMKCQALGGVILHWYYCYDVCAWISLGWAASRDW